MSCLSSFLLTRPSFPSFITTVGSEGADFGYYLTRVVPSQVKVGDGSYSTEFGSCEVSLSSLRFRVSLDFGPDGDGPPIGSKGEG